MNGRHALDAVVGPATACERPPMAEVADPAQSPIDAVVTWVDGSDPAHAAKRLEFQRIEEPGRDRRSVRPTRFEQAGELEWCLRLLRKNAPFLRTIHLVTDAQRPAFLTEALAAELGIVVVDHRALFAGHEAWLPVFNSLSIESMLHRTPGLAPRFVYFNDDVFLVAPVRPETWFDGLRPRLRGRHHRALPLPRKAVREVRRVLSRHLPSSEFRDGFSARYGEAALLPHTRARFFAMAHAPFPLARDELRKLVDEGPLADNARFRFRNAAQANVIAYFTQGALADGRALEGPSDWEYVACTEHARRVVRRRLHRCETDPAVTSLCVQSLERASPGIRADIEEFLRRSLAR